MLQDQEGEIPHWLNNTDTIEINLNNFFARRSEVNNSLRQSSDQDFSSFW